MGSLLLLNTALLSSSWADLTPDAYIDHTSWQCYPHPCGYRNFTKQWSAYLNFGVIIYNDYYKMYRSTGLNKPGLEVLKTHLTLGELDCPKNIVYLKEDDYGADQMKPGS